MIVWLASFPRSGNTLLRQMLKQCFSRNSNSIYNDVADIAVKPEIREAVGHVSYEGNWGPFYNQARTSTETFHIKTHEAPLDDSKAIYVVRHPYRAIPSFLHYLNHVAKNTTADLQAAICGFGLPFPTWGAHLDDWNPLSRPDTLLLKYEDMVGNPEGVIGNLEGFLGCQRQRDWSNPFESLQKNMPAFFREGKTDADGPDPLDAYLIDLLFHEWMDRLGYPHGETPTPEGERPDVRMLGSIIKRFHETSHAERKKIAEFAKSIHTFRQWAEGAEKRFIAQKAITLEYERKAALAAATTRQSHDEKPSL